MKRSGRYDSARRYDFHDSSLTSKYADWTMRQWGIYSLRCLMYHVDNMTDDDVQKLQDVLIDLEGKVKHE